jgi:endonuclease YncB( thermonuclease family)
MFLRTNAYTRAPRGGALMLAALAFAAGLSARTLLAPGKIASNTEMSRTIGRAPQNIPLQNGYSADVLRVLDGDTFEARVRIWPGQDVTTRVRLRGIDAPELHARCDDERVRALAARDALVRILAEGAVAISQVGQDKYGGRVDADAATSRTANVGAAMLDAGLARAYNGGRRQSWCD